MTAALFAPKQRNLTFSTMTVIAVAAYNNLSVNAALPAIGEDLGNVRLLPWIVSIELITSAIAVLVVGPIIDSAGTRTTFRLLIVIFIVSCVLCAFSTSMWMLIVGRGVQGIGGGGLIATALSAIGLGVPEHLRSRAYAMNSSVWGMMGVAGPGLAALLLLVFDWPAIFIVNIPIALFAFFVGSRAMPGPAHKASTGRVDLRGVMLVVVFTFGLLTALSSLSIFSAAGVVVALLALSAYFAHARREETPVLRIRHLTDGVFRGLHAIAFFVITGGVAAHAFLPIYVKGGRSGSTAVAAFSIVFLTIGWTTGSFLASRRADRKRLLAVVHEFSLILFVAVVVLVPLVFLDAPLWMIFATYIPVGLGLGGVSSTGVAAVQKSALPEEMGRVNSAHQFIRTLGFSVGAALSGLALFGVVQQRLGSAEAVRGLLGDDESVVVDAAASEAIRSGYGATLVIAALIAAVGAVVATQVRRNRYVGIGLS